MVSTIHKLRALRWIAKIKTGPTFKHEYYEPNSHWILAVAETLSQLNEQIELRNKERITGPLARLNDVDLLDIRIKHKIADSLMDFETWLIDFEKEVDGDIISAGPHFWWIIKYLQQATEMMNKVTGHEHDVVGICSEDNLIARQQVLRAKRNLKIDLAAKPIMDAVPYTYVAGDWVINAYYPEASNAQVTGYFSSYKKLDELPMKEFDNLLNKRDPVYFQMLESKTVLAIIRKTLLHHFATAVFPK